VGIKLDESNALQASRNERWKPVGGLAALALLALLITRRWQAGDSFAGKVVVITGGSRGLGLALARRLVQAKARVAILARDQEELEKASRDLLAYGPPVTTWQIDVKDDQAVSSTIEKIAAALGGIDALINNAGEIVVGPLEAMNRKDFQDALDIHFWAPFNVIFASLPHLQKSTFARIANIASFGGKLAVPHLAPYCISKFALVGLSDALRSELSSKNISITTVAPGLLRTGSHKNAFFKGDHRKEFTWFSLGAGNPLVSMSADRAAGQILEAMRRRQSELTITFAARMISIAQALLPGMTADLMKVVARLLPRMSFPSQDQVYTGWESESTLSPSLLTLLADRATESYNGSTNHSDVR
jgi:NAD(P)-dependent dehydrogenase (short-subunit alcohol dehydrogenase family)